MVQAGFLEEVGKLYARGDLTPICRRSAAVGYRQLWEHLSGEDDFGLLQDRRAIFATRQLPGAS